MSVWEQKGVPLLRLEPFFQAHVILNNPVMHHSNLSGAVGMGMGVYVRGLPPWVAQRVWPIPALAS